MNQLHDHSKHLLNQLRNSFTTLDEFKDAIIEFMRSLYMGQYDDVIFGIQEDWETLTELPDTEMYYQEVIDALERC